MFLNQLIDFDLTLMKNFERFLGLGSLECLEAFLIYQQVALPICSGVVGLISLTVIVPTAYVKG
jgi:hypothetical protein